MTNLGVLIEIREALPCCCCYLWGPQIYVLAGRNLPGVVDVFAFSVAGGEPRGLRPWLGCCWAGKPVVVGLEKRLIAADHKMVKNRNIIEDTAGADCHPTVDQHLRLRCHSRRGPTQRLQDKHGAILMKTVCSSRIPWRRLLLVSRSNTTHGVSVQCDGWKQRVQLDACFSR